MVGILGTFLAVKLLLLTATPLGVVMEIVPVLPVARVAVICVAELTTKLPTAMPPMLTTVAPVRFVPVMMSGLPTQAVAGKLVMVGPVETAV